MSDIELVYNWLRHSQNNLTVARHSFYDLYPKQVELCNLCIEQDNEFFAIKEKCARLTPYGVETRYPNELAVDEKITEQAVVMAQKVYDFCSSKIPSENFVPLESEK